MFYGKVKGTGRQRHALARANNGIHVIGNELLFLVLSLDNKPVSLAT
jgi:hypothetical protein